MQLMAPLARHDGITSTLEEIRDDLEFIRKVQLQEHQLNAFGPEPAEDVAFSCWPPRTPAQKQVVASYNNNFIGSNNNNCGNTTNNNFNGPKYEASFVGQYIEVGPMPQWPSRN
jgi:hypothetical protein